MPQGERDPHDEPREGDHSIGDVAEATGLSPETLRIWERRYGRPVALRLPSGHRRYTTAQVRWLRRVAEALARGHRPHRVIPLDDAALEELVAPRAPAAPEGALAEHVDLVRHLAGVELRSRLLAAWDPDHHQEYLEHVIVPLVEAVGRGWADGELEVRHEHFASQVLEDVLRTARLDFPIPRHAPRVLLTTLSGERHGLGLQMAALACAARGVPYRLLGVDTPTAEIVLAARELGVDVVGISVSLATGGVETDRILAELRGLLPERVRVVVGGGGARGVRRGPRGVKYVATLRAWEDLVGSLPEAVPD